MVALVYPIFASVLSSRQRARRNRAGCRTTGSDRRGGFLLCVWGGRVRRDPAERGGGIRGRGGASTCPRPGRSSLMPPPCPGLRPLSACPGQARTALSLLFRCCAIALFRNGAIAQ